MLDIVLYCPTGKGDLVDWAKTTPPNNPLLTDDGPREGVSYCWWAGSGKFMTQKGTYDENGDEITPPTFAPGVVALLRIHSDFFENTKLADQTYDEDGNPELEQFQRNAVAKYIKDNGTSGSMAGGTIPYYQLGAVRLLRPSDVDDYCVANNIPGHVWVGGNSH